MNVALLYWHYRKRASLHGWERILSLLTIQVRVRVSFFVFVCCAALLLSLPVQQVMQSILMELYSTSSQQQQSAAAVKHELGFEFFFVGLCFFLFCFGARDEEWEQSLSDNSYIWVFAGWWWWWWWWVCASNERITTTVPPSSSMLASCLRESHIEKVDIALVRWGNKGSQAIDEATQMVKKYTPKHTLMKI